MPNALSIYVRNHEAAAQAGRDLFHRAAANQRKAPYAAELRDLAAEVDGDVASLNDVLRALEVQPDPLLRFMLQAGERVARLKPNGQILLRAPLSDLIEVEGMLDAVHAKLCGWQVLITAGVGDRDGVPDLPALLARAELQLDRLRTIHQSVAATVLVHDRRPSA